MSRAVVLIWLGTLGSRELHEPDLEGWARSRLVSLEEPAADTSLVPAEHDAALSARVEALLSDARTVSFTDPPAAEVSLENAELLLRGNPALPEAPWLMAETCRDHAALVRDQDPALAEILERRATVLDGGRATSFDREEARGAPPRPAAPRPPAPVAPAPSPAPRAALRGPAPGDEVDVDGIPMPEPRTLAPGEHHVRVLRDGQLAWAGWVTADGGTVPIDTPGIVPCSEPDLAQIRVVDDQVRSTGPVLCADFAVARDAGPLRVDVARCAGDRCSTFLPWSRTWGNELEGPMHPPWAGVKSKAWIPWTILGAAAVAAGAVVLVAEGALDRKGEPRDRLVVSGPGSGKP